MWRYGVVHVAVIYSVYQFFGFYYGIVALLALIYCIDKLLDKFGYERLVSGDLLLTLEAPNQNHNIGGYFTINKIKFEEFRQGVYKRAILNLRKMSMIQIERFGFKLWKDVDRELSINQILEWKANLKTEVEWLEYLNNILDENMDYSKPLWEFHFVENFSKHLSVIIVRTHHSFTDAIGFASMMSWMNDDQFIHKIDKKFPSLSLIQKLILILITPFYIIYAMIVTAGITSDPNSATINDLNLFILIIKTQ